MQTIVIASQKGGPGKTTLTAHLAVQAELDGDGPIVISDTDPQGSLSTWWNRRAAGDIGYAPIIQHAQLAKMGYRHLFVDTPGVIDANISAVISLASYVLSPAAPSVLDLDAVASTAELIESAGKC